jgi:hypothetical protein
LSRYSDRVRGRDARELLEGNHDPVDIVVPRRVGSRPGITVHSVASLPATVITSVGGIPVTTPEQTLLDLATVVRYELLRAHDFPPFETNAHPPGAPGWVEVDILFRAQKVVIEVDFGPWHKTAQRRQQDADKQATLEALGYRVIRLTEDDVKPAKINRTLARVQHALGG